MDHEDQMVFPQRVELGNRHGTCAARGITHQQALDLLGSDVSTYEALINRTVSVTLTQSQFDSLVNFSYNIGPNAWTNSTARYWVNYGDPSAAGAQMLRWSGGDTPAVKPGHDLRLGRDAVPFSGGG